MKRDKQLEERKEPSISASTPWDGRQSPEVFAVLRVPLPLAVGAPFLLLKRRIRRLTLADYRPHPSA